MKIKCIDIVLNTVCSLDKLITNPFVSVVLGFLSLQFSRSVMSLRPHGPQHSRLPSPSPTLGAYSNLSIKVVNHPTISSSVIPCSSCLRSFPASGSFPMSRLFPSSRRRLELQLQHQSLKRIFRTDFLIRTGWISMQFKGLSRVFSNTQFKIISSLVLSFLYSPTLTSIHDCWKNHSLD